MDEFFDKLKDGASKTKDVAGRLAKQVAKRTSDAITGTKLTYAINEANNQIKDIYAEIGKTIYENHLEGDNEYPEFDDLISKINALMQDIENLQSKKAELKNAVLCNECDALNSTESEYCSKCGTKLEKSVDDNKDIIIDEVEEIVIEPVEG